MSSITTPTKPSNPVLDIAGKALNDVDDRYHPAAGMRRQLNKVFPSHWSFLLGEIALYSFIVLLLSGVYLSLWFDPSMTDVQYNGPFSDLRGIYMSRAYSSTLDISFVVRGGLFVRQLHHWAALLFVAAMAAHMIRVFFTGAFRKPRETNWVIGVLLLVLGSAEGFSGYGLPDDLLSGTGVRAALSGGVLSTPIIGTWLHWLLFGGEFPGTRSFHGCTRSTSCCCPGIILALIAVHLGLVWYQKHTQFPGRAAHREQRGRRAHHAGVRPQGRRFLRGRRRRAGVAVRAVPDQPGLELRPVLARAGRRRFPAGLVPGLDGRSAAVVAGLGDLLRTQLHDPGGVPGVDGVRPGHHRDA